MLAQILGIDQKVIQVYNNTNIKLMLTYYWNIVRVLKRLKAMTWYLK